MDQNTDETKEQEEIKKVEVVPILLKQMYWPDIFDNAKWNGQSKFKWGHLILFVITIFLIIASSIMLEGDVKTFVIILLWFVAIVCLLIFLLSNSHLYAISDSSFFYTTRMGAERQTWFEVELSKIESFTVTKRNKKIANVTLYFNTLQYMGSFGNISKIKLKRINKVDKLVEILTENNINLIQ